MKLVEHWIDYLDQTGGPLSPLVRRCATHTITQVMQQAHDEALEKAAQALLLSEFDFGFSDDYEKGMQTATNDAIVIIRNLKHKKGE